jgi:hypothetical protein
MVVDYNTENFIGASLCTQKGRKGGRKKGEGKLFFI